MGRRACCARQRTDTDPRTRSACSRCGATAWRRSVEPTQGWEEQTLREWTPRTVKTLRRVSVRTFDELITMYADYGRRGMLGQIRDFGRVDMDEVLRVLERDMFD